MNKIFMIGFLGGFSSIIYCLLYNKNKNKNKDKNKVKFNGKIDIINRGCIKDIIDDIIDDDIIDDDIIVDHI